MAQRGPDEREEGLIGRAPWGWIFASLIVLAAAAIVVDVAVMPEVDPTEGLHHVNVTEDHAIHAISLRAEPGSVVSLFVPRTPTGPAGNYTFYAVPYGEWVPLRLGQVPDRVLHEENGPPGVPFDPDDPGGEVLEVDRTYIRVPEQGGVGGADGLDLVWVFELDEAPEDPEARELFLSYAREGVQAPFHPLWVSPPWAQLVHQTALGMAVVCSLGAAGAGTAWVRSRFWQPRTQDASPSERLLGLVEMGTSYLRYQRAFLLGLAVPLAYAAWVSASWFQARAVVLAGPASGWTEPLVWLFWGIVAILGGSWLVLLARVQQDLLAFERTKREPPLDL